MNEQTPARSPSHTRQSRGFSLAAPVACALVTSGAICALGLIGGASACGGGAFTAGGGGTDSGPIDAAHVDAPMMVGQDGSVKPVEGGVADAAPPPVTIAGRVVDDRLIGLASATVVIGSKSVPTGADGSFSIAGVLPPYNAAVLLSAANGVSPAGFVFVGLTRQDPVLQLVGVKLPVSGSATVTGPVTYSGGAQTGIIWADVPLQAIGGVNATGVIPPVAGPAQYQLNVEWNGTPTVPATLSFLEWMVDSTTGFPLLYTGYGTTQATLSNASASTWSAAASMTAFPPAQLDLVVDPTAAYIVNSIQLSVRGGLAAQAPVLLSDTRGETTVRYATPAFSNATMGLAIAESSKAESSRSSVLFKTGISAASPGTLTETLPAPPTKTTPVDGATGITTSTPFTWTPFSAAGGAVYVSAWSSSTAGAATFVVITSGTAATIPDLSASGLSLASGSYSWGLLAFAPFTSVDAAAGVGGYYGDALAVADNRGPTFDGAYGADKVTTVSTGP